MSRGPAFPGVPFHAVKVEPEPPPASPTLGRQKSEGGAFPGIRVHNDAMRPDGTVVKQEEKKTLIRRKSGKLNNMLTFKGNKSSRQKATPSSMGSRRADTDDEEGSLSEERVNIRFVLDAERRSTGRIASATINKLIEYMTHETITVDNSFRHTFFLTYHSFTNPNELMEKLTDRYMVRGNRGSTKDPLFLTKIRQPIRLKVLGVLKTWLLFYFCDFEEDPQLCEQLVTFLNKTVKDTMPTGYAVLTELLARRQSKDLVKDGTSSAWKFLKRTNSFRPNFEFVNAVDIAEQLTLMEHAIFVRVMPKDFLNRNWLCSTSSGLTQLLAQFERVSSWVQREVDSNQAPEAQVACFLRFVQVAQKMRELNNYHGVMEIIAGLQLTNMWRKKPDLVPNDPTLKSLLELVSDDNNYGAYRVAMENAVAPLVPALQITVEDINHLDEVESDIEEEVMVNWSKREMLANVVYLIFVYQKQPYHFLQENVDVKSWLLKLLVD